MKKVMVSNKMSLVTSKWANVLTLRQDLGSKVISFIRLTNLVGKKK